MNWIPISETGELDRIREKSFAKPQLIFKHSTRCSISSMAKARLERYETPEHIDFYYLDLLNFRNISNEVAESFGVHHESPQVLLIKNGECIYNESHNGIRMEEILETAS
ncbi:MAG: bacillithiol system redox-active protein YtxJ [Ferruginibacter sp.]